MSPLTFWRRSRETDLEDEVQGHLQMAIRNRVERGESPHEAEAAARREFGNVGLVKEVTRDMWSWAWLDRLGQDVRYAVRMFTKRPVSTAVAITTLALAIGANIAIFTLIDRVVLNPLGVSDSSRLVTIQSRYVARGVESRGSGNNYEDFLKAREARTAFEDVAAGGRESAGLQNVAYDVDGPDSPVPVMFITANYFRVIGVSPVRGRDFDPVDDTRTASPVAILSHRVWRTKYGGASEVIGRAIRVSGHHVVIVGVAPPEFTGVNLGAQPPELFLPLMTGPRLLTSLGNYYNTPLVDGLRYSPQSWLTLVGRLKHGASIVQANAEMSTLVGPFTNRSVVPLAETILPFQSRADVLRFVSLLAAAVVLTLLIGCANLASLLLARVEERRGELAMRSALGASRMRLVQQLAIESAMLAAAGGAAALMVATWIEAGLSSFELPGRISVGSLRDGMEARTVAFAVMATAIAAIVVGVAPALRGAGRDLALRVKVQYSGPRVAGARILITLQVMVAVVLMFGATLFVRTLSAALNVDLGFNAHGLVGVSVDVRRGQDRARVASDIEAFTGQVDAIPSVSVTLGPVPFVGAFAYSTPSVNIDGVPTDVAPSNLPVNIAGIGYFAMLGQPLIHGRDFVTGDRPGSGLVAIVNETAAHSFWPGRDPIGRTVTLGSPIKGDLTVVGVVGDVRRRDLKGDPGPALYLARAQYPEFRSPLSIRTTGDPAALIQSLHRTAAALDLSLGTAATVDQRLNVLLMPQRLGRWLLTLLGGTAFVLTLIGIYGLIACVVARTTKQIGIRIALGASSRQVLSATLQLVLGPVLVGVAGGSLLAWWGGRFADRFMYGIRGSDPATLAIAASVLVAAATVAALIPARRALAINPVDALRAE